MASSRASRAAEQPWIRRWRWFVRAWLSGPEFLGLRLHQEFDLLDGGVRGLLHGPLRPLTSGGDLLAGVLADGPDGDLGLLPQLLDVAGEFGPLLPADRR